MTVSDSIVHIKFDRPVKALTSRALHTRLNESLGIFPTQHQRTPSKRRSVSFGGVSPKQVPSSLTIKASKKFRLNSLANHVPARFPMIIRTTPNDDPTPALMYQTRVPCQIVSLLSEFPTKLYRFPGWLIVRFPEFLENGFNRLTTFVTTLFSLHQFPTTFRLWIIVNQSCRIPFSLEQLSIQFSYPPILPPSAQFAYLSAHFSRHILTRQQKQQFQILANFSNAMAVFVRPTAAADIAVSENVNVFDLKSTELIQMKTTFEGPLDELWRERMLLMRTVPRGLPPFHNECMLLSLVPMDGGIEIANISALDCEWNQSEEQFVRADRFYPIPLGRMWACDVKPSRCNAVLYGGDPISVRWRVTAEGEDEFHFLLEE
jgi:hypothetical protein